MALNSTQEARVPRRHPTLVRSGTRWQNIDLGKGQGRRARSCRGPRNPWKLTVLQPPEVLRQGRVRGDPGGVTHIGIVHRRRLGDRDERTAAGLRADDPGGPGCPRPGAR